MRVRFLLGPAGSGKTYRCLAEIREALTRDPEGPPLLLLAPKQATFQLERQLLEDPGLQGWTRLQILSFERFARQILEQSGPLDLLAEEGRIMVLRALLRRHQPQLRVFRATARLTGFAQELSRTLRELHRQKAGPARLRSWADQLGESSVLADKLHDLALLMHGYQTWLAEHHVTDADLLPDLAVEALKKKSGIEQISGLWLDGFAEMTPQEMDLLVALVAITATTTLAFCADQEFQEETAWLSTWAVVSQTVHQLQIRLAALPECELETVVLPRDIPHSRFAESPVLASLERHWTRSTEAPAASRESQALADLRLVACPDFERETEVAAREVWTQVRGGLRFRDIAVMLRSLDEEAEVLERVFARYEIPFFIDRRTPLAHHPLAELTRCAVRLSAFGWQHADWFGALKTGLTPVPVDAIDALENAALAGGWTGEFWLGTTGSTAQSLNPISGQLPEVLRAFHRFDNACRGVVQAVELARSIRSLWEDLRVVHVLESWSMEWPADETAGVVVRVPTSLHATAREQIESWLDNLERGFAGESLPLGDWLPILEAGLSSLTAGVIPPAQDQVLIGAIDRSRQPDIQVAIVAGLNEGRFPAPPPSASLLNNLDRDALADAGIILLPEYRRRIGHERYFAYIALSRARRRVVVTWSERDAEGHCLNPSPFVRHVQRLFPSLLLDRAPSADVPVEAPPAMLPALVEHASELLPWLLAHPETAAFDGVWESGRAWRDIRRTLTSEAPRTLDPAIALALYGAHPRISVSALESLASCPFQCFIRHGLQGQERRTFDADPRKVGSLAHELLARFHRDLRAEGLEWHDVEPSHAHERLKSIAREHPDITSGPFATTPEARWHMHGMIETLADLVSLLVQWARQSNYLPRHAELGFGRSDAGPPWTVDLSPHHHIEVRGVVDRVDVLPSETGPPSFLVIDYKLRKPAVDDVLVIGGIELQLAAYALALMENPQWLNADAASPARVDGVFYVGLRASPERAPGRHRVPTASELRAAWHSHQGRFRSSRLDSLDRDARHQPSGQFRFGFNQDGSLKKGGDAREDAEFEDWLRRVRRTIRRLGLALVAGDVAVAPFRKGPLTACQRCQLQTICRFDPWTQPFRRLTIDDPDP